MYYRSEFLFQEPFEQAFFSRKKQKHPPAILNARSFPEECGQASKGLHQRHSFLKDLDDNWRPPVHQMMVLTRIEIPESYSCDPCTIGYNRWQRRAHLWQLSSEKVNGQTFKESQDFPVQSWCVIREGQIFPSQTATLHSGEERLLWAVWVYSGITLSPWHLIYAILNNLGLCIPNSVIFWQRLLHWAILSLLFYLLSFTCWAWNFLCSPGRSWTFYPVSASQVGGIIDYHPA